MRVADCHPDRRHHCKGLCLECYTREVAIPRSRAWYAANKVRALKNSAAWQAAHPEKMREYRQRWKDPNDARGAWSRRNPEKQATITRTASLRNRYGITPADYNRMFSEQGGRCALCRRPPSGRRLNVDHCHSTGRVRGLLCNICNMAVGLCDADPEYVVRLRGYGK